jgi:hypothetical protein
MSNKEHLPLEFYKNMLPNHEGDNLSPNSGMFSATERDRITEISEQIIYIVEGREHDVSEEDLVNGYGSYGSLDKVLYLIKESTGRERELCISAFGQIFEDDTVATHTKAALFNFTSLTKYGFRGIRESINILSESKQASDPLLRKRLRFYYIGELLDEALAGRIDGSIFGFEKKK